jgi:8-oxo-dGTP diphosphatase
MEGTRIFGDRLEHVHYIVRQGAYAVIINDGMVAVVKTPKGYFLPGVKGTETLENCLKREVLEETGYHIRILQFIGRAQKYFYSTTFHDYMASDGFFYIAEITGEQHSVFEEDHELVWIPREDIPKVLLHEHQAWAVEEAFRLFK